MRQMNFYKRIKWLVSLNVNKYGRYEITFVHKK